MRTAVVRAVEVTALACHIQQAICGSRNGVEMGLLKFSVVIHSGHLAGGHEGGSNQLTDSK